MGYIISLSALALPSLSGVLSGIVLLVTPIGFVVMLVFGQKYWKSIHL